MKHLLWCRPTWKNKKVTFNLHCHIVTALMQQNMPSKCSKTILLRDYAQSTPTSHFNCGENYYHMQC
eukprot:14768613-Ditylum_brightwellii.AAC.1